MTLRVLAEMAEGRRRESWSQLSVVLAMIHNVNCARRSDRKSPQYFNPMRQRRRMGDKQIKQRRHGIMNALIARAERDKSDS